MSKYTKIYLGGTALYVVGVSLAYFVASSPACCAENLDSTVYQQKEKVKMQNHQETSQANNLCAMPYQQEEKATRLQYGHIDAQTLKNLIDTKTPMVILDARGGKWDDGRRIPGGKSLPADSSPELFTQVAPHKDALVVVYCGSIQCPAGKTLVEKMITAGYTHILEYAGGMKEWADEMNYPIEKNSF